MKNAKTELKYLAGLISLGTVCFVLILALIVNVGTAFSWFSSNRDVNATGMNTKVKSSGAESYYYEYIKPIHEGDAPSLSLITSIDCDMRPGEEKTIVVLSRRLTNNRTLLKFDMSNAVISVNYYGLQRGITLPNTTLDSDLENYMRAGDYKYENGGASVIISPYNEAITTANYLGFVSSVSNALKISRTTINVSRNDYATFDLFAEYIAQQINYYNNGNTTDGILNAFGDETVLYNTGDTETQKHRGYNNLNSEVSMSDILASDRNTYFTLKNGTPAAFTDIEINDSNYYAVIYRIRFDSYNPDNADIYGSTTSYQMSVDGTVRDVTMYNSNGFMYQRLKIEDISFPAVIAED